MAFLSKVSVYSRFNVSRIYFCGKAEYSRDIDSKNAQGRLL